MIQSKFTITKDDRLIVFNKAISNAHWLYLKDAMESFLDKEPKNHPLALAHKKVRYLEVGQYNEGPTGVRAELSDSLKACETSGFTSIMPRRDDELKQYSRVLNPTEFKSDVSIYSNIRITSAVCEFVGQDGKTNKIGANPDYFGLAALGIPYAKSPLEPILIINSSVDDISQAKLTDIVAVIMPMRL